MIKTNAEKDDLIERAKELNCLYHVDEALKDINVNYEKAFAEVLRAIPPGWQFPEITTAKIVVEGTEYTPPEFRETIIKQYSDIVAENKTVGRITVYYTAEPDMPDPRKPFLPEEQKLLNAISEKIGNFVFHKRLKETFGVWHSARRTLDALKHDRGRLFKLIANSDLKELEKYLDSPREPVKSADELEEILEAKSDLHWKWRREMTEKIASALKRNNRGKDVFGLEAIYIFGSVKNAHSGPGSDIDILAHFRGAPHQLELFEMWMDGWSRCLAEINRQRTGYKTGKLIDLHIITDEDIINKTSWAKKLTSTEDRAELLAEFDEGEES
jgi:hypothetical protein